MKYKGPVALRNVNPFLLKSGSINKIVSLNVTATYG